MGRDVEERPTWVGCKWAMATAKSSGTVLGNTSNLVVHTLSTGRHTTRYLEVGPVDGQLMIFLHGWPEISLMWRSQLEAFASCFKRFELRERCGVVRRRWHDGHLISTDPGECIIAKAFTEIRSVPQAGIKDATSIHARVSANYSCTFPRYLSSHASTVRTSIGRCSVTSCGVSSTTWLLSAADVPSM
jgi:hypothetical protein